MAKNKIKNILKAKSYKLKANFGSTLIEVLIYSVLLAVFIGAVFAFTASILGGSDTLLEKGEVIANQELAARKLFWIVRQATAVTIPSPNLSSTTLELKGVAAIYPARFSLSNNRLTLSLADGSAVPLTNDRVQVTLFRAENFPSPEPKASTTLRVSLGIRSAVFTYLSSTSTFFYVIP